MLHSSEIPWGSRLAEVSSLSLSLWGVLTTIGVAQHRLSLATSTSLPWPLFSGQTEVAREQLPPPSGFSRLLFVPVLSSQTMVGAAGVLPICSRPFLGFPARVQALAGSGSMARDSEHNLPGRSGVALLLCRLAMCFSLQGVPQEKTFPVFGSGWAAPARG